MAPGYEWVFVTVYATMGLGTMLALYEVVTTHRARRAHKAERRSLPRRPRPPRQVF